MIKILNIVLILSLLVACEETVEDPNLPFKEELVIAGSLTPGESVDEILISKTLHPLDEYDVEKAFIRDADAYIEVDDKQYELKFNEIENSYYVDSLIPEIGKTYNINVSWKEHNAKATTFIPDTVNIEYFEIDYEEFKQEDGGYYNNYSYDVILYAVFAPNSNSAYAGYFGNNVYFDYCFKNSDVKQDGKIHLPIANIYLYSEKQLNHDELKAYIDNRQATVRSWDVDYFNYFTTRYEGDSNDFIFGTSGNNVQGNIENGIGYFYGYSSTTQMLKWE